LFNWSRRQISDEIGLNPKPFCEGLHHTLDYLHFWYPDFGWEKDNPTLADWIAAFN